MKEERVCSTYTHRIFKLISISDDSTGDDEPVREVWRDCELRNCKGCTVWRNPNGDIEEENDIANMNLGDSNALANGLSSMLMNIMRDFDSKADDTLKSQSQLSFSLDRLTSELDQLLEDAPFPFIMQHALRISSVRKRVLSLNSILRSVQRRVDNIDRAISMSNLPDIRSSQSSSQPHNG
ncbi:hypothetical protein SDJN03_01309, partial [Cucurbita argyrosperma subsp. sororia]